MLEKISVKRPFTILVMVVLIAVLGVVSFMNTTTDLMPSMNLPVSVILTTYPGATPEQVESEVTAPIETLMGSIGGIDTVQSVSAEHMSIVILLFTETTNMDAASIEIRESLDMAQLPDGANKPITMKLNPNMMPVMVAAVYREGMAADELSEFIENEIAPSLEGVPGVAGVTPMGLVRNQIHVILRGDKIDAVNEEIADAVSAMIAEATEQAMAEMFEAAMEQVMAEMAPAAEAAITEQVTAYSENFIQELMAAGVPFDEANAQLQASLPAVTEEISAAVMEEMTAQAAAVVEEQIAAQMAAMAEAEGADAPPAEEAPPAGLPAAMLSVDAISGMLTAQNFAMPAGVMPEGDYEYMVRVGDRFTETSDIGDMLIMDPGQMGLEGMDAVRLSDIADVIVSDNSGDSYTHVNGNPTVMMMIQKQTEFATADVTNDLRARADSLKDRYDGLDFVFLMDQGEYIGLIVGSVLSNLIYGGLLAILILLIFLRDVRPTLIVAISIPVSLMLAFTAMYFTGVSLNIISMSGLALAVGMLVDNSIVVIENTYRLRHKGESAARAAVLGAKQVSGAIAASTLTTIAVFFPIVFTEGITRTLFTDLALTIGYSLGASLLIALTVVPAASSALFKSATEKTGKWIKALREAYAKSLRVSLRFKWLVVLIAIGAFAASLWGITRRGMEFIPAMEAPQLTANIELPEESTFEELIEMSDIITERILAIPDVETVGVSASNSESGGGNPLEGMMSMMGGGGANSASMYILLSEDRTISNEEIERRIAETGNGLDAEVSVAGGMEDMMSMMTGAQISVNIQGRELDAIRDTAVEVAELIKSVPGAVDVTDIEESGAPEKRVRVDKDAAMARGLTTAQVFMAVSGALSQPEQTASLTLSGKNYELVINDGDWEGLTEEKLRALEIPNMQGDAVVLSDIAEIYDDTGFLAISRSDRNRYVTITGSIDAGYNVGLVNDEIERLLADYTPREGCTVTIGGEMEAIGDAFGQLYLMIALGLVFIYLIMVAQFQSLLSPFIVLFTIPLAFTGGFIGLMIAGMPLSVVSMIGLVLLMGVVVNNGIVFISTVNQLRRDDQMQKKDALVEAGRIRMRPILMTALTTIAAMSIMALGAGQGTEMVQPMAVASIGGLIYATLMTLYVVPVMYDMFHRNKPMKKVEFGEL